MDNGFTPKILLSKNQYLLRKRNHVIGNLIFQITLQAAITWFTIDNKQHSGTCFPEIQELLKLLCPIFLLSVGSDSNVTLIHNWLRDTDVSTEKLSRFTYVWKHESTAVRGLILTKLFIL